MPNDNKILTKKGNRNFAGLRPKTMSKSRYGILINYYDWHSIESNKNTGFNVIGNVSSIKDLFYEFYEPLRHYGSGNGLLMNPSAYIKKRNILINPVGELHAMRYYLSDYGRKRLTQLKKHKHHENNEKNN